MAPRARTVVVENVYFQRPGYPAVSLTSRFSAPVGSDEQHYQRLLRVGGNWAPVETGWVADVGTLVFANDEGRYQAVQPTAAERAATAEKVLEVGLAGADDRIVAFAVVAPGRSFRLHPAAGARLLVRSRSGTIRVTLTALPA